MAKKLQGIYHELKFYPKLQKWALEPPERAQSKVSSRSRDIWGSGNPPYWEGVDLDLLLGESKIIGSANLDPDLELSLEWK